MDKKEVLSIFYSNPKVKKFLEFIREDKNWVYDLFDVINQRVNHFFKLSYFENNELKNQLALLIFGNILLDIVDAEHNKFLTYAHIVRTKFIPDNEKGLNKGSYLLGMIPLARYDNRRLVKKEINSEINKYLRISSIFINRMKDDESLVRNEFLSLFKEKNKFEEAIEFLFNNVLFSTISSFANTKKDDSNKQKPGPIPQYESKKELLDAIKSIPKTAYNSRTKLAKLLGMSEGNLRDLEKKYNFHYTKI